MHVQVMKSKLLTNTIFRGYSIRLHLRADAHLIVARFEVKIVEIIHMHITNKIEN